MSTRQSTARSLWLAAQPNAALTDTDLLGFWCSLCPGEMYRWPRTSTISAPSLHPKLPPFLINGKSWIYAITASHPHWKGFQNTRAVIKCGSLMKKKNAFRALWSLPKKTHRLLPNVSFLAISKQTCLFTAQSLTGSVTIYPRPTYWKGKETF